MIDVGKKCCTCDARVETSGPDDLGDVLGEETPLLDSLPFNLCTSLFGKSSLSFPLAALTLYIQIVCQTSFHH